MTDFTTTWATIWLHFTNAKRRKIVVKYESLEDFTFQRFVSNETARHKYWQMSTEFYHSLKSVQPNAAHAAITDLETIGTAVGTMLGADDGKKK